MRSCPQAHSPRSRPRLEPARRLLLASLSATLLAGAAAAESGSDWHQFRGPERNGISPETGLVASWPEDGPRELLRRPIGEGYSAPSVVGDRFYLLYADPGDAENPRERAAAFDAESGEELWNTEFDDRIETEYGNGPRSTPAVLDGKLYALGSHGKVAAFDAESGERLWLYDAVEALGGSVPTWGFSSSPLVEKGLVVVELGLPGENAYLALNAVDGSVAWTTGTTTRAGYNSALAVDLEGRRQLVYVVEGQVRGIDFEGNELWSHPWPRGESHSMPIFVSPNQIYASGAEGVGAAVLRISPSSEGGGLAAQEVWSGSHMKNHFSSSLVLDGHLYGFDNATLKCLDVATGELRWAKRGYGKGSLIAADGALYVLTDRGRLVQVRATPEGFEEMGRVQALDGRTWTAPVLSRGQLFLRSHSEVVVYDLRGGEGS